MGKNEILKLLFELDKVDPGKWYSVKEIKDILTSKGSSMGVVNRTCNSLLNLSAFNILDMKGKGIVDHIKLFKLARGVKKN